MQMMKSAGILSAIGGIVFTLSPLTGEACTGMYAGRSSPVRTLIAADQSGPSLVVIEENGAAARIAAEWKPSEDPSVSPEAAATFDAIDECKAVDDGRTYLVNASGGGVA